MEVIITVIRETEYTSVVEMPEAQYKELKSRLDKRNRLAEQEVNRLIDIKDWQDDSLKSVERFDPAMEK